MDTTTIDSAFAALDISFVSILEDAEVSKKGDAIEKSINQFMAFVTGEGFFTIVKEARGEPFVKLIPGLTPEQSFVKAVEADPHSFERYHKTAPPLLPVADKMLAVRCETDLLMAAAEVIKGDRTLTKEQAITKALHLNPALYEVAERAKWGKGPQTE